MATLAAAGTDGIWSALRNRGFRSLWCASIAINLTIWMQSVAAAWLMVSLTPSPLMVALIQTATALPSFLFALPSGVMADLVDRRRYLMTVLGCMVLSALALCLCALGGGLGPWLLLFLTFCLGIGFALQGPAWYTAQTDSVARAMLPSALALSALSYSAARAVGPALAGAMVSGLGVMAVFGLAALLLCVAWLVLLRWDNPKHSSQLPPENLASGMFSVLRYVRHSDVMRVQILRTVLFVGAASSLWALLPLLAGPKVGGGAGAYGLLLGSLGIGSMAGALIMPKLKDRIEMNRLMEWSVVLYALAMLACAYVPNLAVMCAALVLAGMGWLCVGNTNMLAMQSAVPSWIRARVLAVYMLTFQGAMATGSAFWGLVADRIGATPALACCAVLMLPVLLVMRRFPARMGDETEVTQAEGLLALAPMVAAPATDAVVAVQITYQVEPARREEFLRQAYAIGKVRRRDGASMWRIYRDLDGDGRYIERFLVDSWSQYLRQRSRATMADMAAEQRLRAMHSGSAEPQLAHFVSEAEPQAAA
ncbi:MAG: MFS transporter [Pseudomonadota bacterium]